MTFSFTFHTKGCFKLEKLNCLDTKLQMQIKNIPVRCSVMVEISIAKG